MAEQIKDQFKDFVIEEIIPELLNSSGYSYEELMEEEVEFEALEEPEMFNNEVMNNYQLITGDYRFDCYLDEEMIEHVDDKIMTFNDLMQILES